MPTSVYVLSAYDLDHLDETLPYLEQNVKVGTKLITLLSPTTNQKQIRSACQLGFKDPLIISDHEVLLYTTFTNQPLKVNCDRILHLIHIALENWKQPGCSMNLILDKDSLLLLKNYSLHYKFHVGGKESNSIEMEQREVSGIFHCEPITFHPNHSITTLSVVVDKESVSKGEKEEADYKLANGTFHTHPEEAYRNNNVGCAWPSKDDYRTVLDIFSEGYGLFHIVSTVEGIYLITFRSSVDRKEIAKNKKKYDSQIQKNFKFSYPPYGITQSDRLGYIQDHLDLINHTIEPPIFQLQYMEWDAIPESIVIEQEKDGGGSGRCNFLDGQVQFDSFLSELRQDCIKDPKNEMCSKIFKK